MNEESRVNMPLTMMIRRIEEWKDAYHAAYLKCESRQEERYRLECNRADRIQTHLLTLQDLGVQF